MKLVLATLGHMFLFVLLTVLTQVGGLAWIGSRIVLRWWSWSYRWLVFPVLYVLVWALLPLLAAPFGRVPLPIRASAEVPVQPQSLLCVLANRHYVCPQLREETVAVAQELNADNSEFVLTYLDANFPFLNGFPLLPHRSHDDGEKLDFAFFYRYNGKLTSRAPAFVGYGRTIGSESGERNQAERKLHRARIRNFQQVTRYQERRYLRTAGQLQRR